ncbi:MAG: sensor histidine kinase [Candidatus Dormibacteria bacterium]
MTGSWLDAELQFGNQAERYRALLDALSDLGEGLVVTEGGRLVYANNAYLEMTGYSQAELTAKASLIELAPSPLRAQLAAGLADMLAGRRDPSHFLESQLVTRRGRLVDVESSIHLLPSETNTRILAIVRDITERKRIQAELEQLNEGLERRVLERTAMLEATQREMDAFSYSVSHDLRTPLRAIHGFSGILAEQHLAELTPEAQRLVGLVTENAALMGTLVDSLLALSRLGRREMRTEVVGARAVAEAAVDAVRTLHPGTESRITVADLPAVRADPDLLEQVFVSLLDNAVKFSGPQPQPVIRIGYDTKLEEPAFFVRDNGMGFDGRYVDKVFGVFQRLVRQQDYDGVGVGLAIARTIVQRHGGRIWAESTPGHGATFYFTLAAP